MVKNNFFFGIMPYRWAWQLVCKIYKVRKPSYIHLHYHYGFPHPQHKVLSNPVVVWLLRYLLYDYSVWVPDPTNVIFGSRCTHSGIVIGFFF
jgi:hypothetical protein